MHEIKQQNLAYIKDWLRKHSELKPHVKIHTNSAVFTITEKPRTIFYLAENRAVVGGKTLHRSAYELLTRLGWK